MISAHDVQVPLQGQCADADDRDDGRCSPVEITKRSAGCCSYCLWSHMLLPIFAPIGVILVTALYGLGLSTHYTYPCYRETVVQQQNDNITMLRPVGENVVELLHSRALKEAVGTAAVQIRTAATAIQSPGDANRLAITMSHARTSHGKPTQNETTRLSMEAQQQLTNVLQRFFDVHAEARELLAAFFVSAEHARSILLMLKALTDQRVLTIGMHMRRACAWSSASSYSLESCLHQQVVAKKLELQKLREELVPADLLVHVDTRLQAHHVRMLRKQAFKVHSDLGSWHAELNVRFRRLQPQAAHANWFTIGAPVVSNMLGLVFLSLMALLPGTGGFPSNRIANYALWGVQGAVTVAECFANSGFPNVVYFAPCIMDIMFMGLEVIWVFFDGRAVSGPRRHANCNSFARWPRVEGVCGNCMGFVPGPQFEHRCDIFCQSFGHTAMFAAFAVSDSCVPQAQYEVSERVPFDTMLCQCVQLGRQLLDFQIKLRRHTQKPVLSEPSNTLQVARRLKMSTDCRHDIPYTVQVVTSTQRRAALVVPVVSLRVGGETLVEIDFNAVESGFQNRGQVALGETIETAPLFLSQRPDQLTLNFPTRRFVSQSGAYGWRRIVLIHGRETTILIDSLDGTPFANNSFWIGGSRTDVSSMRSFAIPAMGNLSSATATSTSTGTVGLTNTSELPAYTLEVVMSGQQFVSRLFEIEIRAVFHIPDNTPNGTTDEIIIFRDGEITGALQCRAVTITAARRPTQVSLYVSAGTSFWGYREVVFIDDTDAIIPLLSSINGAPLGQNEFWVGTLPSFTRRMNTFEVPGTTTTSTTTTSTTTSSTTTSSTTTSSTTTLSTTTTSFTTTSPPARDVGFQCPSYSAWPNILGLTCGNCEALVPAEPYSSRCDLYCLSFDTKCLTAWDDINGTCSRRNRTPCHLPITNAGIGMLCTCAYDGVVVEPPQQCQAYASWPQVRVNVCGGCKAVVPLRVPVLNFGSSCEEFCSSFGHRCIAAALQGSSICSTRQLLDCPESPKEAPEALCTCVQ